MCFISIVKVLLISKKTKNMVHFFKLKTEKCKYLNSVLFVCLLSMLSFSCLSVKHCDKTKAKNHIGAQIKSHRIDKGYTLKELANAVQMSEENLALIEKGLATPIYPKLITIQEFLNAEFVLSLDN
jgi:DNA-binding XRE family transcriptional regulator